MTISKRLQEFFEKANISYELSQHPTTYTSSETAGIQHVKGGDYIKTVILKAEGDFIMCVLSASHLVDFEKLKKTLNLKEVKLATEKEVADLFPDYDVGAEPPFGKEQGLTVYADKQLESGNRSIFFNAGTHTDTVKIHIKDYKKLAQPNFIDFTTHL